MVHLPELREMIFRKGLSFVLLNESSLTTGAKREKA